MAYPGCAQLGPDVPLPPPADQLPDQALSERSQFQGGARRSPLLVETETPGTEESPASKQGGAGSGRCSWIWGCRALRLRIGHQLWLLGRPLPGQIFGGKLPRSVPETCSRAPGRQRGRWPWGQDRGQSSPSREGSVSERLAGVVAGGSGRMPGTIRWVHAGDPVRPCAHFRSFSSGRQTGECVRLCDESPHPGWFLPPFHPAFLPHNPTQRPPDPASPELQPRLPWMPRLLHTTGPISFQPHPTLTRAPPPQRIASCV